MIRIAHFSDLHYGPKNLVEADRCFGFAVEEAIRRGVDVAVVSGDATDHALDVHSPAVAQLAGRVRQLADHCPVLMLQGTFSHEPPGTLALFRLLGGRHPRACRGPAEPGRADAGRRLARVAALVLRGAAGRREGALHVRADRQQGERGGQRRRRRGERGARRAAGGAAGGLRAGERGGPPRRRADRRRLARHRERLPHRARRADGRLRPRVHDGRALRGADAGIHAGAHPSPPALGGRRPCGGLRRLDRTLPPRRGGRQGLRRLERRAPRTSTSSWLPRRHAVRWTSSSRARPTWKCFAQPRPIGASRAPGCGCAGRWPTRSGTGSTRPRCEGVLAECGRRAARGPDRAGDEGAGAGDLEPSVARRQGRHMGRSGRGTRRCASRLPCAARAPRAARDRCRAAVRCTGARGCCREVRTGSGVGHAGDTARRRARGRDTPLATRCLPTAPACRSRSKARSPHEPGEVG